MKNAMEELAEAKQWIAEHDAEEKAEKDPVPWLARGFAFGFGLAIPLALAIGGGIVIGIEVENQITKQQIRDAVREARERVMDHSEPDAAARGSDAAARRPYPPK